MLRVVGILAGLVYVALLGALLFACAGRTDLPWFWAYLAVWTGLSVVGPL